MSIIINKQEVYQTNLSLHNINTGNKQHLHRPNDNISFKKTNFYAGIKIFNSLPLSAKIFKNDNANLEAALKITAYTLLLVCRWNLCVKMFYNTVVTCFVVFCTVNLYFLCVCMYVCMNECMNVHTYVCMYVCVYVCMYVCMYVRMYVCVYVCIMYYVCMYACMHACMYACLYVCVYVYMYVCLYVCMFVCVYVYTYVLCMYVYVYI